jgi:hypothetical protein
LYWDIIAPNNTKRIFRLERFISLLISALAASFLTSCASVQGFPSDPSDSSTVLLSLQKYFTSDIEDQYYDAPNDEVRRRLRDRIVLGQMRGYDIQFANFQREIYGNSNLVSTGGDIVVLATNAVATVTGGEVTKAALAAGSAFMVGTQGAISKDLFYQRTIPALLAQMEANRTDAKTTIVLGLKQSVADYSLAQAYVDLEALRNAAGIPSAISNVTQAASEAAQSATKQLQEATIGQFSTTSSAVTLRAWIKKSPANWSILTGWITQRFGANKVATESFLILSVYEAARQMAIKNLINRGV